LQRELEWSRPAINVSVLFDHVKQNQLGLEFLRQGGRKGGGGK
jgi:hypothetical protein